MYYPCDYSMINRNTYMPFHKTKTFHDMCSLQRNLFLIRCSGDGEIRTLDPLLARQVLSQLSYAPIYSGSHLLSHTVTGIVSSAA